MNLIVATCLLLMLPNSCITFVGIMMLMRKKINNYQFCCSHINILLFFQVPIALPAVLCLVSVAIVGLTFYQKPTESLTALGITAIGTVLYIIGNRWNPKPQAIQSRIGELFLVVS